VRISLNSPCSGGFSEGGRIGAGPTLRLARSVLLFFSRWWQLESLYRSNAKYRPTWEPRLLCFASSRDLARISVAMGIAEGFISVPSAGALLRRGQQQPAAGPTYVPPTGAAVPTELSTVEDPYADLPEQMRVRRIKLDQLRARGIEPYPVGYPRTASVADVRAPTPTCRRTPGPGTRSP
jgi:lysyl-tRNA synthetase class 2